MEDEITNKWVMRFSKSKMKVGNCGEKKEGMIAIARKEKEITV